MRRMVETSRCRVVEKGRTMNRLNRYALSMGVFARILRAKADFHAASLRFCSIADGNNSGRGEGPQRGYRRGCECHRDQHRYIQLSRSAVTESDGSYRFPALAVGNYQVRVTHEGFQTAQRAGLTLEVAQEAVVDLILQVGSTSQTVTASPEAVPLVDTTSSSVGVDR